MSYFSRVTLDARNCEALKRVHRLRNEPYAQHQALWHLFDRPVGAQQPFVFRNLADEPSHRLRFLLVSDDRPASPADDWRIESKVYAPKPLVGARYRFSVRLNPTRSEFVAGMRGKRQDLVMSLLHELPKAHRAAERHRIVHEELPKWLHSRGQRCGFEVEQCAVDLYDVLRLNKGNHKVTLGAADFSGCLRVADPDRMREVLRQGFGHGRSFGMGLLLLQPLRPTHET